MVRDREVNCPYCKGEGYVRYLNAEGQWEEETCPECHGDRTLSAFYLYSGE